ncbi:hypothetical protein TNIN_15571 [Trichonephila inaurata madagascariensis]|uniref:Uncharacterized protein n=1 Tax=Trichonephila inaurata madagascariensis TaxID=2747483 RepID=A0A8X7CF18_9ARAC|nr:hypothetical protein TNIN_15571 [Trichonephila inaurata madagascariensis]
MTIGAPKQEIQPFSMLSATVSARMSGIGSASIHRLYRSMIVKQKRNSSDDGGLFSANSHRICRSWSQILELFLILEKSYRKKESLLTPRPFPVPLLYLRNKLLV